MKPILALLFCVAGLSACSETPLEERDDAVIAETEKQIESDAQSLEEAADEAVKILEADLAAELPDPDLNIETGPPPSESEIN